MSDIPEDIKYIASEVARSGNSFFEREDNIAKAIWAERQRCAKIADDLELDTPRYLSAGSEISCFHNGIEFACDRISQAILNQTEE